MGKIFIISGPSGCGKDTIIEGLLKMPDLSIASAKSYTTRQKRASDDVEQHYIFVDDEKFKLLIQEGEILESNLYNGAWYGASKSELKKSFSGGNNVIKDIDVNGGVNLKKLLPDVVLIFLKADLSDIKNRLIHRGQNSPEEMEKRLQTAKQELDFEKEYDYTIINPEGHPEEAIEEIANIIKIN